MMVSEDFVSTGQLMVSLAILLDPIVRPPVGGGGGATKMYLVLSFARKNKLLIIKMCDNKDIRT